MYIDLKNTTFNSLITTCVRSSTGGYVFTGVCLFNFLGAGGGEGTYLPADGGGGYLPSSWQRRYLPSSQWGGGGGRGESGGTYLPADRRVPTRVSKPPPPSQGRYTLPSGQGTYPLPSGTYCQSGYHPPPFQETEQHSEYLLPVGRYASCVYAGGLSCFIIRTSVVIGCPFLSATADGRYASCVYAGGLSCFIIRTSVVIGCLLSPQPLPPVLHSRK